jgi:hypothetical protein
MAATPYCNCCTDDLRCGDHRPMACPSLTHGRGWISPEVSDGGSGTRGIMSVRDGGSSGGACFVVSVISEEPAPVNRGSSCRFTKCAVGCWHG